MNRILSEKEGVGKVVVCSSCDAVHLGVGTITMNMTKESFLGLAEMLQEAVQHPYLTTKAERPRPIADLASLFSRA